jgi:Spy/CpxP family protein refolding chaperone
MNSINNAFKAALLVAGAALTAGTSLGVAAAADQSATAPPPPGPPGWHHHGGPWHLLGKLGLSEAQRAQIKDIMTAARPQLKSLHEQIHANQLKLQQTSPTNPNYSSIVSEVSQTHGSLQAQLLTQDAEVRAQVFKVLTTAQQAQLTALEAQIQARMAARKHGPPPGEEPAP